MARTTCRSRTRRVSCYWRSLSRCSALRCSLHRACRAPGTTRNRSWRTRRVEWIRRHALLVHLSEDHVLLDTQAQHLVRLCVSEPGDATETACEISARFDVELGELRGVGTNCSDLHVDRRRDVREALAERTRLRV